MKSIKLLLFSLLSGLLLFAAWPPSGIPFVTFFAFIPFLFISDAIEEDKLRFPFLKALLFSYPGLLLWNVLTTWWIWNSTPEGSVAAFLLNALLMATIFGMGQWFRRHIKGFFPFALFFISLWISFEYLHLQWDLSWPWLHLGNAFASLTQYVQWYEFTGVFGGTLWILGANFLFYYWIKSLKESKRKKRSSMIIATLWFIAPIVISLIIFYQYEPKEKNPIEVIIVQQNTDPWEEQYTMANVQHTERIMEVAYPYLTSETALIVSAESSIPHTINSDKLIRRAYKTELNLYNPYCGFVLLDSLLARHPNLNIIAGLSTRSIYADKATPTARQLPNRKFEDLFNTSICYNREGVTGIYHKSKLVPGVEKMPFPKIFGFLENLVIDLGGPSGSLGIDSAQKAFPTSIMNGSCKIGVPICYESIYGELFSHFIADGASLMAVITNDAWWGNTPGHKQHFLYAKLRAIETRRTILRAANTGFSGIINEKGEVIYKTRYEERTAIRAKVYPNDKITFYVKYGDYIASLGLSVFSLLFIWVLYVIFSKNKSPEFLKKIRKKYSRITS